jgi:Holliday junction resolvasome RuvABC endonuclease subunit
MSLMGLDLSCTATGIAVLADDGAVLALDRVGRKLTRAATVRDKVERLMHIADRVLRVRDQFDVRTIAVENYAFHARGAQNDLAELHGVVKMQLWLRNQIEVRLVHASAARKAVLGVGRIEKADIVRVVRARGVAVADDNQADAWVVAEWLRLEEDAHAGARDNGKE